VEPKPIHAQGFFTVSKTGRFVEIIRFDYYDPEEYYADIYHNEEKYYWETWKLAHNMQAELDSEEVFINGTRTKPKVLLVNIEHSGAPELPHVTFIIEFSGPLKKGVNTYENVYEAEVAEYDLEAYWIFPPGTIIKCFEGDMEYDIKERVLYLWKRKGDFVKGYEKIVFELS